MPKHPKTRECIGSLENYQCPVERIWHPPNVTGIKIIIDKSTLRSSKTSLWNGTTRSGSMLVSHSQSKENTPMSRITIGHVHTRLWPKWTKPLSKISIKICFHEIKDFGDFLVIDMDVAYNTFLGCPWMQKEAYNVLLGCPWMLKWYKIIILTLLLDHYLWAQ